MRGERERVFSEGEIRVLKSKGLYKERLVEAGLIMYSSTTRIREKTNRPTPA